MEEDWQALGSRLGAAGQGGWRVRGWRGRPREGRQRAGGEKPRTQEDTQKLPKNKLGGGCPNGSEYNKYQPKHALGRYRARKNRELFWGTGLAPHQKNQELHFGGSRYRAGWQEGKPGTCLCELRYWAGPQEEKTTDFLAGLRYRAGP